MNIQYNKIICWWSGGITSAVACKFAIDLFGKGNCQSVFIDTGNEDYDTYRFKDDCEKWFGIEIETITGLTDDKFPTIQAVWRHYKSLNVANGAICSSTLKRDVRLKWQKENEYDYQVFGFDIDEPRRAKSMTKNYVEAKAIYPLLFHGLTKKDCISIVINAGIKIPRAYELGFHNNNCLKTMCIQGGIGYWQKVKRDMPEKFDAMASVEHELTKLKGQPVTMLKDQSGEVKKKVEETGDKTVQLIFLKPHPNYPTIKDISMMKGRPPKPLFECNGFGCAINDLQPKNETEKEINYNKQWNKKDLTK
ncbi:MAG: phosphoadenosine phosphosulfate reductase family protein [Candidatus Peribacteraceae bacterium]|nr:phosphoadenosine phosphosulfate reductase family protein [Candidatus Peribacteraceae bacterium]